MRSLITWLEINLVFERRLLLLFNYESIILISFTCSSCVVSSNKPVVSTEILFLSLLLLSSLVASESERRVFKKERKIFHLHPFFFFAFHVFLLLLVLLTIVIIIIPRNDLKRIMFLGHDARVHSHDSDTGMTAWVRCYLLCTLTDSTTYTWRRWETCPRHHRRRRWIRKKERLDRALDCSNSKTSTNTNTDPKDAVSLLDDDEDDEEEGQSSEFTPASVVIGIVIDAGL